MNTFSEQEQQAVSAISNIMKYGCNAVEKRPRDENENDADAAGGMRPTKMARPSNSASGRELLPAPYFYYRDHSMEVDDDPLTPLTPPGRVPNFPAKMHAILSRPDFVDIVSWLPHGRAWRILKPREFEVRVIPMFFEHSKFSSFVRQANGWGFRRITQGRDRNAYYHEQFLRGLPFLSKKMKRPGPNEKKSADPEHEPDLYKISEENPVPEKADDDSILLNCTVQGGPKARMPIYWGSTMAATSNPAPSLIQMAQAVTPKDQMAFSAFQRAMGASEQQVISNQVPISPLQASPQVESKPVVSPLPTFLNLPLQTSNSSSPVPQESHFAALAAANQMALQMPAMNMAAASHFAAGFAAATAFTQQQYSAMFSSMQQTLNQQTHNTQPHLPAKNNSLY